MSNESNGFNYLKVENFINACNIQQNMLDEIVENQNPNLDRRKFLKLGLAALAAAAIGGMPINPAYAAGDNTQTTTAEQTIQSPYSPISENSNILVYNALTPENLAEKLIKPGQEENLGETISYLFDTNIKRVEFGQKPEQLEKLIRWSYIQAATHTDEYGRNISYPTNKEEMEQLVQQIGLPIFLKEYIGAIKEEDGKKYIVPLKTKDEIRFSSGMISDKKEEPVCEYELYLKMKIDPKTGEIERTEILPKRNELYSLPPNYKKFKYGYDLLFGDIFVQTLIGYEIPETNAYISGCIKKEGNENKIYFSPPTIWSINPK